MRKVTLGSLDVVLTGGTDRDGGGDGPLVVLMHGFGAPGDDLVSFARVMDVPREVRFAFPAAPMDLGRDYAGGRAWWWVDVTRNQMAAARGEVLDRSKEVPEGMAEARAAVIAMLDLLAPESSAAPLLLGGFSQGAMLACDVALRTTCPLAGLALLSGTLLAQQEWAPLALKRRGLKTLITHGHNDPMLPFVQSEKLRDMLTKGGLDVQWVPFRGAHEIPPTALEALTKQVRDLGTRVAQ